jgi:hypothetical protein
MRRLIALILLLIVPLQFSWSVAMGVHGHRGGDSHAVGMQADDHDLHANSDSDPVSNHTHTLAGDTDVGHNDDCHHVSHCHHVFTAAFMASGLTLGQSQPDVAPAHPAARFTSHTPLLQNPPPPARA